MDDVIIIKVVGLGEGSLNIRSEPKTGNNILIKVDNGDTFEFLDESNVMISLNTEDISFLFHVVEFDGSSNLSLLFVDSDMIDDGTVFDQQFTMITLEKQ